MTALSCESDRSVIADVPSSFRVHDHRLSGAAYRASPNADARANPQDLSLIVTRGPEIDHSPPPKLAPLAPGRLTHHPPTVLQNLS